MDERYREAIDAFNELLGEARRRGLHEPTAMTLATAGADGRPSARTVLLKGVDDTGFVFYTNFNSRKARQLEENPRAALCFLWKPLLRQVQVEGSVERVTDAEADAYWATRPRESQLGAWASQQSAVLDDRATLDRRYETYRERFAEQSVPRPDNWGGFRVVPEMIELWYGRTHRLHDRVRYRRDDAGWVKELLNP